MPRPVRLSLFLCILLLGCTGQRPSSPFGFDPDQGGEPTHDPERVIAHVAVVRYYADGDGALGDEVAELVARSLRAQGGLRVVSGDTVNLYRPEGELDDAKARVLGRGLSVDIVVYGDVVRIGERTIVSSRVLRVDGEQPAETQVLASADPARFEPDTENHGEDLARQLYANPALAGSRLEGKGGRWSGQGPHPSDRYWRSTTMRGDLIGVALGDLDGDGTVETVACTERGVAVARRDGERFTPVAAADDLGHIVAVSCFDSDGDGRDEIFLSGIAVERPHSQWLQLTDDGLEVLASGIPYHLRAMDTPQGRRLLGQEGALTAAFSGPIYAMRRDGAEIVADEPLDLPFHPDLFEFGFLNIKGSRNSGIVALTENLQLKVYDASGNELWKSSKSFGGKRFGYRSRIDAANNSFLDGGDGDDFVAITAPIEVVDLDMDGRQEVLLAFNAGYAGSFFESIQLYYEGRVLCYGWTGLAMTELWATQAYANYVSQGAFGDQDNDGEPELVLAVALQSSQIPYLSRSSALAVHDIVGR